MLFNLEVINSIKDYLIENKQTLSVAESVTAGYLQAGFSAATDASVYFQGGITAYNAGQKCRHLDVEPIYAEEKNCVSENVASQMALAANRLFLSEFGIGITGYATVIPASGITDLFAFFAIAYKNEVLLTKRMITSKKDSIQVQLDYAGQVFKAFDNLLKEKQQLS